MANSTDDIEASMWCRDVLHWPHLDHCDPWLGWLADEQPTLVIVTDKRVLGG